MSSNRLLSPGAAHQPEDGRGALASPPSGIAQRGTAAGQSPLFLDGWLEFNRSKWGLQPHRWRSRPSGPDSAEVEAVLYLDARGRIVLPRLNPFLPVAFQPTPARSPIKIARQWLEIAELLVLEMCERRLGATVMLPPEVLDVRPWIWAGFQVSVRYTYYNDLPVDAEEVDPAVRKKCRQARSSGYTCGRSYRMADAVACVRETEKHQGFTHGLTARDLEHLRELLGDDGFRVYVGCDSAGTPVSALLVLNRRGGRAMGWVGGTATQHARSGVTQLLFRYALEDLHTVGASGFDFSGASIRNVAAAKMKWGGQLVPYFTLQADYSLRTLAKWLHDWLRYSRTGRKPRRGAFRADVSLPGEGSAGVRQFAKREDSGD